LLIPPEQGNNRSTGTDVTAVNAVTDGESAQAVLAAADAAFEQLAAADIGQGVSGGYDAAVEVEPAFPGGSNGQGIEPLPLVMHEAHTEQE
jgi:predicted exporter